METKPLLGIIGGSGLYSMRGLQQIETREVDTPFGRPSSPLLLGKLGDTPVAFLARHGLGHVLMPGEINYRANIHALKHVGVERVVAVSACGSLREDFAPGHLVVPDQLFDHTHARKRSFFGEGVVAHASVADPFCPDLSRQVADSIEAAGGIVHRAGTFITIEGPAFSTRAESNIYRAWGMSIIGMTTSPEAHLAREAQLCYAVMAHVTDYDVWRVQSEPVSVEMVIRTLQENTALVETSLAKLAATVPGERHCACAAAMKDALITSRSAIAPAAKERLKELLNGLID